MHHAPAAQLHRRADARPGVDLQLADLLAETAPLPQHSLPRRVRTPQEGQQRSQIKGRGMDYDESRNYQPGDEIRHMDWKVTARTGRPHTKVFCSEKGQTHWILIDFSPCMFFATVHALKSVIAARLAARVLWRAQAQGDRVGLLHFDDQTLERSMPAQRRPALLQSLQRLVLHHQRQLAANTSPGQSDRLLTALQALRPLLTPGAAVTVVCNTFALQHSQQALLAHMAHAHALQLISLHDPLEQALPPAALYPLQDGAGTRLLDAGDRQLRARYADQFQRHLDDWQLFARRHALRWLALSTADGLSGIVAPPAAPEGWSA